MINPAVWLPIMTVGLVSLGGFLALCMCRVSARAEKEALHQQELRDIDEWLERMWGA